MAATNMQSLLAAVDLTTVKSIDVKLSADKDSAVRIKKPKDGSIVCYEDTYELAALDGLGNVVQTVDTTTMVDFTVKYNKA